MIKGKISAVLKPTQVEQQDEEIKNDFNALTPDEFDWIEFEKMNLVNLIPNSKIKTKIGEIVYSHADYAQADYHKYSENTDNIRFEVPYKGESIEALIVEIHDNTAFLDINYKEYAYLDLNKEEKRYLNNIKVGSIITVKIITDKQHNIPIMASYSDAIKVIKQEEIKNSINLPCAFESTIKTLITGAGFIVDIDGIECFMPGSQITMNKINNFEDYVGKQVIVMPINYSPEKGTIVVSARSYLQTLMPSAVEFVKENPKQKYKGTVTGTTKFGVFCEFGIENNSPKCLTGLIYSSDLDKQHAALHLNRNINPGDEIEFYVKELAHKNKIILTQTPENNPWNDIDIKYKIQSSVVGTVLTVKDYGAFVELEKGVSGLLHFSEYEGLDLIEGDKIKVTITRIEKSSKKITFVISK
jgi:small subunit ribosomal protein S1